MPAKYVYSKSREAFFKTLGETREETERRMRDEPGWKVMDEFLMQLIFIQNCTANGRKPTFAERKSITMGRTAVRAFDGVSDSDWLEYQARILDIASYFKLWRSDKGLETFDNEDWRSSFPDDYDFSDEPDTPANKPSVTKR